MAKSYDTRGTYINKKDEAFLKSIQLCYYCGATEKISTDHIIPMEKGGKSNIENLTRACWSCNSRKTNFPLEIWLDRCYANRTLNRNKTNGYLHRLQNEVKRHGLNNIDQIKWLTKKINEGRQMHTYFTKIIHSITNKKYIITPQWH